ncbi:MAG TPA: DUF3516 domain-containing protein [Phycisphaerales bacterium]|nr:DUF3516 domain-containing protein [Phycisphaerales bacterium]HMP37699.1 DUF3516 domain-containing protein [Phycisphaerales bacterium]
MTAPAPLLAHRPASAEASDCLIAFMEHCEASGIDPYPAQIAAFEAIFEERSVVLATPTGSGKSLVALAAHFGRYWRGHAGLDPSVPAHLRRSVYTAPTKALVNEKFFQLCDAFGAANLGLMTGDATVNAEAPIICCTAEILESIALRQGVEAPFGWVVMDEFHYFSDAERGSAWLVPLLEMTSARFLLMSATLHDLEPEALCADLRRRTGADAVAIVSKERPVPLEFRYQDDRLLMETIEEIRRDGLVPLYVVSFRRRDAAELAPKLKAKGLDAKERERRATIEAELERHRLDTPFGRKLRELLPHGLAVHHGGMLPKYRRLVERLASQGLVSVISGTDTLGVGVNMPIRSVLFTQLSKGGGPAGMHQLKAGEFRQIAGRAGRKGHDDMGTVFVQPPEHDVANVRKKRKAEASGKKFHPESPPPGFKGWNEKTMEKLRDAAIDRLVPRFAVTGPLVLQILRRAGDGREALGRLIASVGTRQEEHGAMAERVLAAFEESGLARRLDAPDDSGCLYDLANAAECIDSFDRPLVPFVRFAVAALRADDAEVAAAGAARAEGEDRGAAGRAGSGGADGSSPAERPDFDLDVLTIAESIVDDPLEVLNAQRRKLREARRQELWAPGQSIEESNAMKDELDAITHVKPMEAELDAWFRAWSARHPFIADREPSPKSVARDLLERGVSFADYVRDLDLVHHEQTLYHYLADVQKVLARAVPPDERSDAIQALLDDLAALVETIDSSVGEEWARHGLPPEAERAAAGAPSPRAPRRAGIDGLLRRMIRSRAFGWVEALERGDFAALAAGPAGADPEGAAAATLPRGLSPEAIASAFEPYWSQYDAIRLDADARGPELFELDESTGRVRQWLLDPEDDRQWSIEAQVDLERSREEGRPVMRVVAIVDAGR